MILWLIFYILLKAQSYFLYLVSFPGISVSPSIDDALRRIGTYNYLSRNIKNALILPTYASTVIISSSRRARRFSGGFAAMCPSRQPRVSPYLVSPCFPTITARGNIWGNTAILIIPVSTQISTNTHFIAHSPSNLKNSCNYGGCQANQPFPVLPAPSSILILCDPFGVMQNFALSIDKECVMQMVDGE